MDIIIVNNEPMPNANSGKGRNINHGLAGSKHHQNIR